MVRIGAAAEVMVDLHVITEDGYSNLARDLSLADHPY